MNSFAALVPIALNRALGSYRCFVRGAGQEWWRSLCRAGDQGAGRQQRRAQEHEQADAQAGQDRAQDEKGRLFDAAALLTQGVRYTLL